ncbi:MAG: zinc metalloprotease HtpX [Candidatus Aenigmarchaeota archaeon]|nr:zinc metalloprotease HtpX [Candidatus Aenigmarchaeota archaeon]
MWLQLKMFLLTTILFGILYAMIAAVAAYMGIEGFFFYGVVAIGIIFIQYMIGPKIVEWSMGVHYVSEKDAPELHKMVAELAEKAGIKKPRVGISEIAVPNAFAFGRWKSDGRVCVTRGILNLMKEDELRAVLGHEISHINNRDVAFITLLSVIPMICWFVSRGTLYSSGRNKGNAVLIGIAAFVLYFVTQLLVLYASRIREYGADKGSVKLGNKPSSMASALYKLVYGSARANKDSLKHVEGFKAFFVNDPSRAISDFQNLKELDSDMSGSIEKDELAKIRNSKVRVSTGDKLMEILSTHPNMLKRVQHLSTLE